MNGSLIINADDWGRTRETTSRTVECIRWGAVSAVSAMVFMEDSERAAALALEHGVDTGLHLNFTTQFSSPGSPAGLRLRLEQVASCLQQHRLAQVLYHPRLASAFEYLVAAQCEEYRRLYGGPVRRLDGHHHMHLCANVLLQRLLPVDTIVRRNFHFDRGEKGFWNRLYRRAVDRTLACRHRLVNSYFSIAPIRPDRLSRIYCLARQSVVELGTHPVVPEEYRYLRSEQIFDDLGDVRIVQPSAIAWTARLASRSACDHL